jgi:hypothetical protein
MRVADQVPRTFEWLALISSNTALLRFVVRQRDGRLLFALLTDVGQMERGCDGDRHYSIYS